VTTVEIAGGHQSFFENSAPNSVLFLSNVIYFSLDLRLSPQVLPQSGIVQPNSVLGDLRARPWASDARRALLP